MGRVVQHDKASLSLKLETAIDVYYEKMPQIYLLVDPSILEKEVPP
jgi:hypothetical protein